MESFLTALVLRQVRTISTVNRFLQYFDLFHQLKGAYPIPATPNYLKVEPTCRARSSAFYDWLHPQTRGNSASNFRVGPTVQQNRHPLVSLTGEIRL